MSQDERMGGCTEDCVRAHRMRQAQGCTCGFREPHNPDHLNGYKAILPEGIHRLRPA
jgi:hypothetical protein